MTAAYKEGLYQKSAAPWMEDITTVLQPLPFNLSQASTSSTLVRDEFIMHHISARLQRSWPDTLGVTSAGCILLPGWHMVS